MSDAVGIHSHPTLKLGRRPAVDKPALRLTDFLGVVPDHPIVDAAPELTWPMDGNDSFGDCVVAGSDHALEAIYTLLTGSYTNWTAELVVKFYKTQNPDFDPSSSTNGPGSAADGGMVIQDFLNYLVHQGIILGFAKFNPLNEDVMKAATYLGLAVITGEDLSVSQQSQSTWDYVPGDQPWGGHCTCTVGYVGTPDTDTVVSWGTTFPVTQAFVDHQISEAWFIVTQAHVDNPSFRAGFDLAKFAAAYKAITGSNFPVVVPPPPPPPDPSPTPTPPAPGPPPAPPPSPGPTPPPAPTPPTSPHHRPHWWDEFVQWVESFFDA